MPQLISFIEIGRNSVHDPGGGPSDGCPYRRDNTPPIASRTRSPFDPFILTGEMIDACAHSIGMDP